MKRPAYSFTDFDRRGPMLWLGVGFVVLLLASGRLHGLRALVGLAASIWLVLKFVIPSILEGHSAVAVALTGSLAVLLITIPLCYGIRAKAISAWLGTAVSLFLAVALASAFTHIAHLSGAASEEATLLSARNGVRGVGCLDRPDGQPSIDRDRSTAGECGASLPVLLILSIGGTSFADAVNSEAVAGEVIAALVGSIGLIASMPITTALAALLATRMSDRQLALEQTHAH